MLYVYNQWKENARFDLKQALQSCPPSVPGFLLPVQNVQECAEVMGFLQSTTPSVAAWITETESRDFVSNLLNISMSDKLLHNIHNMQPLDYYRKI